MRLGFALVCVVFCHTCFAAYTFQRSHWVSLGPEVYHIKRTRAGGSVQRGFLYGVRGSYDRIKLWGIYWGADGQAAGGRIKGHSGNDAPLRSRLVELSTEGRLGYTLPLPVRTWGFVTPFAAGGYFHERNDFLYPTPLEVEFQIKFGYLGIGALAGISARSGLFFGLRYEAQVMMDARCLVREESDQTKARLLVSEEMCHSVDLYLAQALCIGRRRLMVGLMPFYRCRHYGGRENFPFDFFSTRYYLVGVRVLFSFQF